MKMERKIYIERKMYKKNSCLIAIFVTILIAILVYFIVR